MSSQAPRRPRVLFLSGLQVHPTLSGGNLRSFALAGALRRQGLDVFVHSLVGRKSDYLARRPSSVQTWPGGVEEHVDRGRFGFLAQFGSYALSLPPLWLTASLRAGAVSPGEVLLPTLLRQRLAWCDAVVADFPFVHPVFAAPSARGRLRILSTHNLEHRLYPGTSTYGRALRAIVRRTELAAAAACDVLVTCCAGDKEFFEGQVTLPRSLLVPNGIEPERFHGIASRRAAMRESLGIPDDVRVLLFTASKYGPNGEALGYLLDFARRQARLLEERRLHILVAGNVTKDPIRLPGFTATGKVEAVEPYFAAADAALNPVSTGAGTNVKMCEFIAVRLPIVTTAFGARGFRLEDGKTAFLFERDGLGAALSTVRDFFDRRPDFLRRMADDAYAANQRAIDMDACVAPLAEAIKEGRAVTRGEASALSACPAPEPL
ncbi:MAG TPA: glycosyltransferase [Vicinamibacteria bacterium]|nr:glycosyltransferase [Vicinamibacteria bacterium]